MLAVQTDAERFPFDPAAQAELVREGIELVTVAGHDPDAIAAAGRDADALFHYLGPLDAGLLARLRSCRVVARMGAGYDSIDVVEARARGIAVVYTPEFASEDVADHAIALMLACARKIAIGDREVRRGCWPGYAELGPMHRLAGRTLGLLGYGRIARHVGAKARAFGLHVVAHDPFVDPREFSQNGVEAVPLDGLLGRAHVLSVHVALTPATRHLIGADAMARLPRGAILVNTSRGPVVDEDALAAALVSGHLSGAGLDVLEHEPPDPANALLRCPTVVLTPHSASFTDEALADSRRLAIEDVARVLRGEPPLRPVP